MPSAGRGDVARLGSFVSSLINAFAMVVVLLLALGLSFWAYRARADRSAYVGLLLLFGFPGALLTVAGLVSSIAGQQVGPVLLALGLGMGLPLLAPFRRVLARVTPIDPASPVDMTGLCVFLPIVFGLLVASVLNPSTPDEGDLTAVTTIDLVLQVGLFVALAFVIVGWPTVRGGREALDRLGVRRPALATVGISIGFVLLTLIAYSVIAGLTAVIQPEVFDELEAVTDDMTAGNQNLLGAALIGITAGVGEELLFRGALQPRFGLILTSTAFAVIHAPQYGLSLIILALFAVGVILGIERQRFGTLAAMLTHALYNFIAVMLASTQ